MTILSIFNTYWIKVKKITPFLARYVDLLKFSMKFRRKKVKIDNSSYACLPNRVFRIKGLFKNLRKLRALPIPMVEVSSLPLMFPTILQAKLDSRKSLKSRLILLNSSLR